MSDDKRIKIECPCGKSKVSGKSKDVELLANLRVSCDSCRRQLLRVDDELQFVRPKGEVLN